MSQYGPEFFRKFADLIEGANEPEREMQHYAKDIDFYGLFDADTFDEEVIEGNVFKGYMVHDGQRTLAASFIQDADGVGGMGWYDDDLI